MLSILLGLVAAAAAVDLCTVPGVGTGVCISTSTCSSRGGSQYSGHCSGGTDIQCCVNIFCGNGGLCMTTNECDGGIRTGLCPGPSSFACCENIPCDGGKGKCMPASQCTGTAVASMCPGPSSYVCCEGATPPPTGGGEKIVAAARSMVNRYPYSWGGGNDHGATKGTKQPESPYCDDRNVLGFDCSGLSKYSVYQGTGISIGHGATMQFHDTKAKHYSISSKQPGDLVFFGSSKSDIHHVAIYIGNNKMVEAPGHNKDCSGIPVREVDLRTKNLIDEVARYW